jgi:hypothetical protein
MKLRFVTRKVHAYLDYPVAVSLIALPFVLGLGVSNPLAKWLSVVTGVAAFVLPVLTNHELGIIKVLPFRFHLAVDRMVGVTFVLAPDRSRFHGPRCCLLLGQRGSPIGCDIPVQFLRACDSLFPAR